MSVYTDNGYEGRTDYLKCMSEDFGVSIQIVETLADTLGPEEDFDGLITMLEDLEPNES